MKKHYLLSAAVATMMMAPVAASAQYITEAPAGGFDFSKGKDYVVIYSPEAQLGVMGDRVLSNQNLDPAMVDNQFYYWTADWDATLFTLYNIEDTQVNSFGGTDKLNMTPLFEWGSGNFAAKAKDYDLSAITDEHVLHIGFMNIGTEDATAQFQFSLEPSAKAGTAYASHPFGGFKLQVNTDLGAMSGKFVGVGSAPDRNKWYYLDIPVSALTDEDGDFGFEYDFSKPVNGTIFTCGFNGATVSTYTASNAPDPDTGMKSITIREKGSAMAIDHVFLYKPDGTAGIRQVANGTGAVGQVFDLAGRPAAMNRPGLYVVKTADGSVRKVARQSY